MAAQAGGQVSGDDGARIAREELADPDYGNNDPGLLQRIYDAVAEWLAELLRVIGESDSVPGGWWVLGPVLAVLALLVVALLLYTRPARRARRRGALFDPATALTAAAHRARADRHAAAGEYADAVRERLRAFTRDLEERAIVAPRSGRTATELASEASVALPAHRVELHRAATVFNDVWYGGREATAEHARMLEELDTRLAAGRPVHPQDAGAGAAR
ncbi:uncharacterized protein DUF4129 [Murinocardiopsis flavida]|uniref:Uncharacterized protein DUF4129 n=1 Tax=Murinocardiopsis flavida TaxID=645275 RepID=A0A2P8DIR4_9ACTN|nr:uncharacterized protein DUF4129 [Murinocardiopsis flavida]